MTSFAPLARALSERGVRYVLIGVSGVNLHAHRAGVVFTTQDRDVFLPREATNLLRAWQACEERGLELTSSGEPLDRPRDRLLAERVVQLAAATTATDGEGLQVDLTLVMTGFDFDEVWRGRVVFGLAGVEVPVARLEHIVTSEANAGRDKDRLFLATHEAALRELLAPEED
jgi:predicted nucleotidyltransferase